MSRWKKMCIFSVSALAMMLVAQTLIAAPTFVVAPNPATNPGRVGIGYTAVTVAATNGAGDSGNITLSISSGSLPAGLSIAPLTGASPLTATITGIPGTAGTFPFTIDATPDTGTVGSYATSITIRPALGSISPAVLANLKVGSAVNQLFTVSGGTGPFTWSYSGTLPPGLAFSAGGILSGTPTTTGLYSFTIQVTDTAAPVVNTSVAYNVTVEPPFTAIASEGQICFDTDITRDVNGNITKTGNLFVKNLATSVERKVTNYGNMGTGGTGAILNPTFTPDGSMVLYTYSPDPVTLNFKVYMVSTQATVSDPSQGLILTSHNIEAIPASVNAKYAAISPNYDGNQGLIVFTYQRADRTELWSYNFLTENLTQIKSEALFGIMHPVFLNSTTIAYVGVKNGIQDIYIVNVDGGSSLKITANTSITPQYGRIQSSWRNSSLTNPLLIYSKRVYEEFGYGNWDVYIATVDTASGVLSEFPSVTNTPDTDEFSAAFYGDDVIRDWTTLGLVKGQMFYEASILTANRDLWQTNYDTVTQLDSNVSKLQRDTRTNVGLVNWSPIPTAQVPDIVTIDQTRFVYVMTSGSYRQIYRADWNGTDFGGSAAVQLTTSSRDKQEPSMARNGGKISYTGVPIGMGGTYNIVKMNHDGSGLVNFANAIGSLPMNDSFVSQDGRWIVFVKQEGLNLFGIYAKPVKQDSSNSDTPIVTGISASAIDTPSFNPDMTRIVYAVQAPGFHFDVFTVKVVVDNVSINTTGAPVQITNTTTIDERYPSFSNNGNKIIYCSDKELGSGQLEIFTMDINGSGIQKVAAGSGHKYPVYGPVADTANNTDLIAFIEGGSIQYGTLSRAGGLATDITPSGIAPAVGYERFAWGINRTKGTVVAARTLATSTAAGLDLTYRITIDVDEANVPNSYTISETFANGASGFGVPHVRVDGVLADTTLYDNSPSAGLQTLKLLFLAGKNGGVADHVLTITMTASSTPGTQAFVGDVNYPLDGSYVTVAITGNSSVMLENPYMPVDRYDADNLVQSDGKIQDYDLLYAIDSWAQDAQLIGYGIVWPENIGNWDAILIGIPNSGIIKIWADTTFKGGYAYDPAIGTNPAVAYEMYWVPGVF